MTKEKYAGVSNVPAHNKNNNGITLIALIITIIIMLILVGVSITAAINGGLFNTANQAKQKTTVARNKELEISEGQIEIDGKKYVSYQEYLDNKLSNYKTSIDGVAEGVTLISQTELKEMDKDLYKAAEEGKIVAVLSETIDGEKIRAVIPEGFKVSTVDGENSISEGLVIYDGESENNRNNEFVWIPVRTDFTVTFTSDSSYSEPTELEYIYNDYEFDSQEQLDYYFGEGYYTYPQTEEQKKDVNNNFAYASHYTEMVASVNKYDGFYIGRYETTIDDEGKIGSKYDTKVLTASAVLKEGTNELSNDKYRNRWWGLYEKQRNSDIKGNKQYIQTNMIWGQQWNAMLEFIGETQANSTITGTQSVVLKTGEATYDNGIKDEMNNIYDLRRNGRDWTAEADGTKGRVFRGGHYESIHSVSYRNYSTPEKDLSNISSRIALCIK